MCLVPPVSVRLNFAPLPESLDKKLLGQNKRRPFALLPEGTICCVGEEKSSAVVSALSHHATLRAPQEPNPHTFIKQGNSTHA